LIPINDDDAHETDADVPIDDSLFIGRETHDKAQNFQQDIISPHSIGWFLGLVADFRSMEPLQIRVPLSSLSSAQSLVFVTAKINLRSSLTIRFTISSRFLSNGNDNDISGDEGGEGVQTGSTLWYN